MSKSVRELIERRNKLRSDIIDAIVRLQNEFEEDTKVAVKSIELGFIEATSVSDISEGYLKRYCVSDAEIKLYI